MNLLSRQGTILPANCLKNNLIVLLEYMDRKHPVVENTSYTVY